jgi:hypothetical protein
VRAEGRLALEETEGGEVVVGLAEHGSDGKRDEQE